MTAPASAAPPLTPAQWRVAAVMGTADDWTIVTSWPQQPLDELEALGLVERRRVTRASGVRSYVRARLTERGLALLVCARCGCSQRRACEGGCWWAAPALCTRCAAAAYKAIKP